MSNETGLSSFDKLGIGFSSNGGGGGNNPIPAETLTKAQLDDRITEESLVVGAFYLITGVDVNLYGGTTVLLQATSTNTLGSNGYGLFFTPKYAGVGNGIWDNANTYAIGDTAFWGGYVWENLTGNAGFNTGDFELNDGDWDKIAYNTADYNVAWDIIQYDYTNDWITYRKDKLGNVVDGVQFGIDDFNNSPIKVFMWGGSNTDCKLTNAYINILNIKGYCNSFTLGKYSYCNSFTLGNSSYCETFTLGNSSYCNSFTLGNGSYCTSFTLGNSSNCTSFTLGNNSYFQNFTLGDSSYCNSFTLGNNSNCTSFTLGDNSSFNTLTLGNNSSIYLSNTGTLPQSIEILTIQDNCSVNVDISAATTIYQTFPKTIFAREDGTPRLSYYNNSDVQVIVDVDN
jgi:hypothetical protein